MKKLEQLIEEEVKKHIREDGLLDFGKYDHDELRASYRRLVVEAMMRMKTNIEDKKKPSLKKLLSAIFQATVSNTYMNGYNTALTEILSHLDTNIAEFIGKEK